MSAIDVLIWLVVVLIFAVILTFTVLAIAAVIAAIADVSMKQREKREGSRVQDGRIRS